MRAGIDEADKATQAALGRQETVLSEIRRGLEESSSLLSRTGNQLAENKRRYEWIQNLGSELKAFLQQIIYDHMAIYRELASLRTAFEARVVLPISEHPFIFEDACGRIAPIHLSYITSWASFYAVLQIKFAAHPDFNMILHEQYSLREYGTERFIDRSLDIRDAIFPGQKVIQSVVIPGSIEPYHQQGSLKAPGPFCTADSGAWNAETQW